MTRFLLLPLLALFAVMAAPVMAETAPATPPAAEKSPAAKPAAQVDEKREGKMRDRWRKMSPEQRDDMRKKAERRLQERYERLSQQEQGQVNTLMAEMDKLSKEQRSVLMAKINQKGHKDRQQRRLMKEMGAEKTPAAATPETPAATPAVQKPVAPEVAPVPAPAPVASPTVPAPASAEPAPAPATAPAAGH